MLQTATRTDALASPAKGRQVLARGESPWMRPVEWRSSPERGDRDFRPCRAARSVGSPRSRVSRPWLTTSGPSGLFPQETSPVWMTMSNAAANETTAQAPLPHPRWRKRLRRATLAILLVCLAGSAYVFYFFKSAERQLQKTIAEIDRQDPGWRLEELEARRKVVPPDVNSALPVKAALALRTNPWPVGQNQFEDMFRDLVPTIRLHERDAIALRAEMKKYLARK